MELYMRYFIGNKENTLSLNKKKVTKEPSITNINLLTLTEANSNIANEHQY